MLLAESKGWGIELCSTAFLPRPRIPYPRTQMVIQENVPLAPYTTLKIGGPARYFAQVDSESDLLCAVRFADEKDLPLFILGGGSNLVVSDAGFHGLVLKTAFGREPAIVASEDRLYFEVSAGVDWNDFVRIVCEEGVYGVECLAGIPGLVGGAPIQNIGAYGQDVGATIASLRALDLDAGQFVDMPRHWLQFAYRSSIFNSAQRDRYIVTRVDFHFSSHGKPNLNYPDLKRRFADNSTPTPLEIYHAVREIRAAKGMLIDPAYRTPDSTSAGSFFKNPVVPLGALDRIAQRLAMGKDEIQHWPVNARLEAADPGGTVPQRIEGETKLPAAWLIERAGFPKGYTLGPVGISTKHTLALTNRTGTATCAELLALRDQIISGVEEAFGVKLEQEPVYLS